MADANARDAAVLHCSASYRMPESLSALFRIVSLIAANTSRMLFVFVSRVTLGDALAHKKQNVRMQHEGKK
jgi:hypothetical protein